MESHDAEFRESGQGWARKPSRFHATPAEIDAFLRVHFAEDTLLRYQQAIGNRAVAEAAVDARALQPHVDDGFTLRASFIAAWQEGASDAADHIDPRRDGGPYPSTLVGLLRTRADGLDGGVL
jgi:hypothetical protein